MTWNYRISTKSSAPDLHRILCVLNFNKCYPRYIHVIMNLQRTCIKNNTIRIVFFFVKSSSRGRNFTGFELFRKLICISREYCENAGSREQHLLKITSCESYFTYIYIYNIYYEDNNILKTSKTKPHDHLTRCEIW